MPAAVEIANATTPSPRMNSVFEFKKRSAVIVRPTEEPKNIVTMFMSSFWAHLLSLSQTPDSLMKLPNMSIPIKAEQSGTSIITKIVTNTQNMSFSSLLTFRKLVILILRSASVVKALIIGG